MAATMGMDRRTEEDALHKQLLKFTRLSDLQSLARKLFQKRIGADNEIDRIVERNSAADQVGALRQFIMNTVMEATLPGSRSALPGDIESYISFCHVHRVFSHLDSVVWNTFVLKDYEPRIHDEDDGDPLNVRPRVPLIKLRKKIKKHLSSSSETPTLVSVQFDVDRVKDPRGDPEEKVELVLFRILVVNQRRNRRDGDRMKLLFNPPSIYAYFPGEPYVYANHGQPDKDHLEAIAQSLSCSSYKILPLTGNDLHSLRKLRLARDGSKSAAAFVAPTVESPPILKSFTVHSISTFEMAAGRKGKKSNPSLTNFEWNLSFKGKDVLNGFKTLCDNKVFEQPIPEWLENSGVRGRNYVKIQRKQQQPRPPQQQRDASQEDEECSLAESEMTAL